jgi:hypothetical protein
MAERAVLTAVAARAALRTGVRSDRATSMPARAAAATVEGAFELEGMAMDGMGPTASVGNGVGSFPHVTGVLLLRMVSVRASLRTITIYRDISPVNPVQQGP